VPKGFQLTFVLNPDVEATAFVSDIAVVSFRGSELQLRHKIIGNQSGFSP
jgi:hypothetical protein